MNHFEADRAYLGEIRERLARSGNGSNAFANGGWTIETFATRLADPLHAPLGQNGLLRHIEDAELERGATDIWNQTLHHNRAFR